MAGLLSFSAEKKERSGKFSARHLRNNGRIPAIVYGKHEAVMLSLSAKEFLHQYYMGNIQSRVAELTLDGKKIIAMPREIQLHPVTDVPTHVDFQKIDADTQIKVAVHVKITNTDKCPGVKRGGVLNVAHRYINMWCLPDNIPESIEVNVGNLEIGRSLHIGDLEIPKGVQPVDQTNFSVVSISGREKEEEKAVDSTTDAAKAPAAEEAKK